MDKSFGFYTTKKLKARLRFSQEDINLKTKPVQSLL